MNENSIKMSQAAFLRGRLVDIVPLQWILHNSEMVDDFHFIVRQDTTGEEYLIIYFVPKPGYLEKTLYSEFRLKIPDIAPSCILSPVSSLPLDSKGFIDEPSLKRIGVVESDITQQWERRLRAICGDRHVAVIDEGNRSPAAALHLWDLLPELESVSGQIAEPATLRNDGLKNNRKIDLNFGNKLSISHGGELKCLQDSPSTLAESLKTTAAIFPAQGIVFIDGQKEVFQSYSDLLKDAERVHAGLRRIQVQPKDKVVFQFNDNREFLTSFWGCILGGVIPVPLGVAPDYTENNVAVKKLTETWKMLDHPIIIASEKLGDPIRSLSKNMDLNDLRIHTFDQLVRANETVDWHTSSPSDIALIMMTSGSTGQPKGVMLTHENLLSRSAGSAQMNGFCEKDISLNWMPLDHVAGIIFFHLRDVALGIKQIQVPTETILQDPLKWLDMIERFGVSITFAPNFAFGLVNDHEEEIKRRKWDLSNLRFVLNGAEAIVARTARKFLRLLIPHGLPSSAMVPAWGMSETSSGVIYSRKFSMETTMDNDPFVEIGAPIPGVDIRIVDNTGEILDEGQVGNLEVKGATLMRGYYGRPDLNEKAFNSDGWFNTGDLGFIQNGLLTITGREKDVIIINSVNYYCHEIEGVVEQIDDIVTSFTAACAVRESGSDTDELAIFFHTPTSSNPELVELLKTIRRRIVAHIGIGPQYLLPVAKADIPKTEIGKIQRSKLADQFQKGAFKGVLKRMDLLTASSNTLPSWFFKPVWRARRADEIMNRPGTGCCLMFLDENGLGDCLAQKISAEGRSVVTISAGNGFSRVNENHYTILPGNKDHCGRVLAELRDRCGGLDHIFYLWPYERHFADPTALEEVESLLDKSLFGLLSLIKMLPRDGETPTNLQLFIVCSYAWKVLPEDLSMWSNAFLQGIVTSLSRENPWLKCRIIDLPVGAPESDAAMIHAESLKKVADQIVALRLGKRYVWRMKPVSFEEKNIQSLPFKTGSLYLISGGLGGIGIEIAKFLIKKFNAKLLLLGRTPLAKDAPADGATSKERAEAFLQLEQMNGSIRYAVQDVCDLSGLKRVTAEAERDWGCKLEGILHLAGTFHEKLLVDETRDSMLEILHPKITGAWALHQLVKDRPGSLFISFGSVNGALGGFMVGAYSAANAFLDSFAAHQRDHSGLQSYTLSWSMWDETGMSRRYAMKDLARMRGFYSLSIQQALNSFLACLHQGQSQCYIGLDSANPDIAKWIDVNPIAVRQSVVCFSKKLDPDTKSRLRREALLDRFGTQYQSAFREIDDFPMTTDGMIDRSALEAQLEEGFKQFAERNAPSSDLEKIIAHAWQGVLQREIRDIEANFFDLGGNSLLMAKVNVELKKKLQRDIRLADLFRFSTVRALAQFLAGGEVIPAVEEMAASRIKGAARRSRMLQRRKGGASA